MTSVFLIRAIETQNLGKDQASAALPAVAGLILDPYGMTFDPGPAFWLLFKSGISYCDDKFYHQRDLEPMHSFDGNPEADGENKGFSKKNPLFMKS